MTIFRLSASFAAISLATAAMAAPVPSATERAAAPTRLHPTVAREAEPGDDHHKGRRLSDETPTSVAREAETGDDGGQRRRHGGRAIEETPAPTTIAREAETGDDGGQRRRHGGRAIEETPASTIIAREDETETEDESGDDGHQRRGGRG